MGKFTWFQCKGVLPPSPNIMSFTGNWHQIETPDLPTEAKEYLCTDSLTLESKLPQSLQPYEVQKSWNLTFDLNAGITSSGEWLSFGDADHPADQRSANAMSTSWTTSIITELTNIIGKPVFKCGFTLKNDAQGTIIVRLTDIFPDGKARLISWGAQNLNEIVKNQPHQPLEMGKR